jgi:hypothetical protein
MKTSVRRQCLRQMLGANRKVTSIRWIGQWTARVQLCRVHNRSSAYVKADNGAEKSLRSQRRRKRGLRHGKNRSREGKSRRTSTHPAPVPKQSPRRLNHHIRMVEHWTKRESELRKRMHASVKSGYVIDKGKPGFMYSEWRKVYLALASRVPKFQRRMIFGSSFAGYMEERFRLDLSHREKLGGFGDLMDHLRIVVQLPIGTEPGRPKVEVGEDVCRVCGLIHRFIAGNRLCPAIRQRLPICRLCGDQHSGECRPKEPLRRRNAVRYSRRGRRG